MKKIFLISTLLIFFGLATQAFAQGFVPLAPIPGLTQGATANSEGLVKFFNNLYKYLIGIAAILAVIQIIWAGIKIATNQDNVSTVTDSKGKIAQAIYGLVLVLSPVLVFSIINPSILNLSLSLPPLDTKSTPTTSAVNTTSPSGAKTIAPINPTDAQYMLCTASTCSDVQKECAKKGTSKNPTSKEIVCLKSDGSDTGTVNKPAQAFACAAGQNLAVKCIIFK